MRLHNSDRWKSSSLGDSHRCTSPKQNQDVSGQVSTGKQQCSANQCVMNGASIVHWESIHHTDSVGQMALDNFRPSDDRQWSAVIEGQYNYHRRMVDKHKTVENRLSTPKANLNKSRPVSNDDKTTSLRAVSDISIMLLSFFSFLCLYSTLHHTHPNTR